ncbi:hypothetical protein ES708_21682 [subsurface metagenome]
MGLYFVYQGKAVIETDYSGIVLEHAQQPGSIKFLGYPLDIGIEDGIDPNFFTVFICVMDNAVEYLVVTMLGPGLGNSFQLYIRGPCFKPHPPALCLHLFLPEVIAYGLHLLKIQGQGPVLTDLNKLRITCFQVNKLRFFILSCPNARFCDTSYSHGLVHTVFSHTGRLRFRGFRVRPLLKVEDIRLLDQAVGQQFTCNTLRLSAVHAA